MGPVKRQAPIRGTFRLAACAVGLLLAACSPSGEGPAAPAPVPRHLVLVTIDTLRADRVGVYGHAAARTPVLDRVAREGVRFDRAFATAPITLTSHASLLTGRYPPGHGSRHNGVRMAAGTPTLATWLRGQGFATGAFVAAFPLDRRFGLDAGFDVYGDRLPRGADGRPGVERPGREVVDEAIAWWRQPHGGRRFLWVHLFEPHAPYGDPAVAAARPALDRYDEEVATADREVGRLIEALAPAAAETLLVVASDHGEAFGEHGEVGHSVFVYDTTLRVPLLVRGPGVPAARVVPDAVSLVDLAHTVTRLLHVPPLDGDGLDLSPVFEGRPLPARGLYAESFAPLLDFGWSPLRSIRSGRWKAVAAPRPELYDVSCDPGERHDLAAPAGNAGSAPAPALARAPGDAAPAGTLDALLADIEGYGPPDLPADVPAGADPEARSRLAALGYLQGGQPARRERPDPKDRRELAARIARSVSGEVQGDALRALLEGIVREDPGNGQMRQRLGYALLEAGRPREAEPHFRVAIDARLPSADPYLGLALCLGSRGADAEALATLRRADGVEPGNAVVLANIGIAEAGQARLPEAAASLEAALALDPDLHEARFNLARVHARAGRREPARRQVEELLRRLPPSAPQRREVERLLAALR